MGCKSSKAAQAPAQTAANAPVADSSALAPAEDEQAKTVTAEEASTAAPTEVEVATDAPVDAVKMQETMVEEAEPAAPVGQHPVDEKASPEEAAPVEPKELEAVEQAVEEADVKAIEQSALVDETAQSFQNGEMVAVWRKTRGASSSRWRPGVCMEQVRGNYWIWCPGGCIKASANQLRLVNREERAAWRLVVSSLRSTLRMNLDSMKVNDYDDITKDGDPPIAVLAKSAVAAEASQAKEEHVIVPEVVIEDSPAPVKCRFFC